jgi:hypothetical protein
VQRNQNHIRVAGILLNARHKLRTADARQGRADQHQVNSPGLQGGKGLLAAGRYLNPISFTAQDEGCHFQSLRIGVNNQHTLICHSVKASFLWIAFVSPVVGAIRDIEFNGRTNPAQGMLQQSFRNPCSSLNAAPKAMGVECPVSRRSSCSYRL